MRTLLPLALAVGGLHAAAIRGTVVEGATGKPLARALVVLEPVRGTEAQAARMRTSSFGTFEFSALPPGAYLITASRDGFAPVHYGQKHWGAAGRPLRLDARGSVDLNIPLPRFGAVAGTVVDENDVGLPDHEVVAYRLARIPTVAGRSRTDDRGRYRISGLEPGRYFVRTVARQYEDSGYLPTYYKETLRRDGALPVDVDLDQQIEDVNVRPASGRLFTIRGRINPPVAVNVTLVTDTGAETTLSDAEGRFQFRPVAPGQYEVYGQEAGDSQAGVRAVYESLIVDRDVELRLALRPLPEVQFVFRDVQGHPIDAGAIHLMARRRDVSGIGRTQTLELPGDRVEFLPGRWDIALAPTPDYYLANFLVGRESRPARRSGDWNELLLSGPEVVQFVLSTNPGSVHGTVVGREHNPVAGAPVYLETYDGESRRRFPDVQLTRADIHGQYRFAGLAPGSYRVLSSYEFNPSNEIADPPASRTLQVEAGSDVPQDLEVTEIR